MAAGCWATVCFVYCQGVCLASCILRSNRTQWPGLRRGSANKQTALRKHKLSVGYMPYSDHIHAAYMLARTRWKHARCHQVSHLIFWHLQLVLKAVTLKIYPCFDCERHNGVWFILFHNIQRKYLGARTVGSQRIENHSNNTFSYFVPHSDWRNRPNVKLTNKLCKCDDARQLEQSLPLFLW